MWREQYVTISFWVKEEEGEREEEEGCFNSQDEMSCNLPAYNNWYFGGVRLLRSSAAKMFNDWRLF